MWNKINTVLITELAPNNNITTYKCVLVILWIKTLSMISSSGHFSKFPRTGAYVKGLHHSYDPVYGNLLHCFLCEQGSSNPCTPRHVYRPAHNKSSKKMSLRFISVCLCRDEQAPLFSVCTQLSSGAAVASGAHRIWELQTCRIPLETWPSKRRSVLKDTSVCWTYNIKCMFASNE